MMKNEVMIKKLKARIALMLANGKDNSAIVRKCQRQLRNLEQLL